MHLSLIHELVWCTGCPDLCGKLFSCILMFFFVLMMVLWQPNVFLNNHFYTLLPNSIYVEVVDRVDKVSGRFE